MQNVDAVIGRFQVRLATLVGGADTYSNRCFDYHCDKAREIEKVAKAKGKLFEMVIYENAEHVYHLAGRYYRIDCARDTWKRTEEWVKRAHADSGKWKTMAKPNTWPR